MHASVMTVVGSPISLASTAQRFVAAVLVLGVFGTVLVHLDSVVFDLERYQVPKALVLHLVALALLVHAVWRRRAMRPLSGLEVLTAAFVAWSALSAILATNRWLALASWGIAFSGFVALRAAGGLTHADDRRWVLGGVLGAVVLGAALGVAQAYGWDASWLDSARAPGGTFGNRNFLAHLSAIGAPVFLVYGLAPGPARRRLLALAGLGLVVLAIVLTRSRAGWLGAAIALAVATAGVVHARRAVQASRRSGLGWVALVVVLAGTAAVALPNALEWRDDSPYAGTLARLTDFREGSGRGRLIQYRNSMELMAQHPVLGVGPGNWFVHYPTVTEPGDPAFGGHLAIPTNPWPSSDWVAMASERGALGALLLFAAGAWALVMGLRRMGSGGAVGHRGAAAAGVVVATAVTGTFDAVLLLPTPTLLVATLLGVLLADPPGSGNELRGNALGATTATRWRLAGVGVAGTLVLVTGLHAGAVHVTRDDARAATLEQAARIAPWEHRLHLDLAEAGDCGHARAVARLMPFHARATALAEACGDG